MVNTEDLIKAVQYNVKVNLDLDMKEYYLIVSALSIIDSNFDSFMANSPQFREYMIKQNINRNYIKDLAMKLGVSEKLAHKDKHGLE